MDKVLLDTDIFSEILKWKNLNIAKRAKEYHAVLGRYTVSMLSVMEIVKGLHKVYRETQIRQFLTEISKAEVLTLNVKSAELTGRIYADLERKGLPIGRIDPMIAAIALENNLMLVTGNSKHFQSIQDVGYDLKLDNWRN